MKNFKLCKNFAKNTIKEGVSDELCHVIILKIHLF